MRLSCAVMVAFALPIFGGVSFAQTPADRSPVPGAPAGVTAFVDVGVIPMDRERTLAHQTVLVREGRIVALGPVATIPVPPGAVRIDGRGRYLMPGLGACHGHISLVNPSTDFAGLGLRRQSFPIRDPRYTEFALFGMYVARGVTVLRNADYMDVDSVPAAARDGFFMALRDRDRLWLRGAAAAGTLWSPRLYIAGQWGPKQYFAGWQVPDSGVVPRLDSIAAHVAAYQAAGFDFLKLEPEGPEIADSLLAAARRIGLPVGGHIERGRSFARALAWGQQVVDHSGPYESDSADSVLAVDAGARRRAGMWTCDVGGGGYGAFGRRPSLRSMVDSGAGILLGKDFQAGLVALADFVEHQGLTPYEALATGTKNFGQYLRTLDPHSDETGTIGVGQRADLVLLRGNPLRDIRYAAALDTLPPELVMIGGRWLAGADLRRRVATLNQYLALRVEWVDLRRDILGDSSLTAIERQAVVQLDSVYQEQQFVLAHRFVLSPAPAGGADSLGGPSALVALFAQQLGGLRTVLQSPAHERFDATARAWLAQRAKAGQRVTVAGVRRRPRCGPALAALSYSWSGPKSLYGAAVDRHPCSAPRRALPPAARVQAP